MAEKNLMKGLTEGHLPAERPAQPVDVEPRDPGEGSTPGPVRREHHPPERTTERVAEPPVTKEAPAKKYVYKGKTYNSLKELEDAGVIVSALTTAEQFPTIQEKYTKLLEESKARPAVTTTDAAPATQLTNKQIATVFDPVAQPIIQEMVRDGLLEEDMVQAYPRATLTMVGQLRFLATLLYDARAALEQMIAQVGQRFQADNYEAAVGKLEAALDKLQVVSKEYEVLNDRGVRDGFVEYLKTLDPSFTHSLGEHSDEFLRRQYWAYNHEALLEAAGNGTHDRKPITTDKRLVGSERPGARPAVKPKGEGTLLDQLIKSSGRFPDR